ncbi:hypothetical protein [uncultured Acinetobacter sp.]|uniref:hypothetical protein n=1 Tax=uncultured Acinetobacter sp. TaxID=165433 RepID=UPI00258B7BC7|nr:hypothetical protein [uncultured Acinetobacter sp.]
MSGASGNTRQELASINASIDNIALKDAYDSLTMLIKGLSQDELSLVAPDIKATISKFFKKKQKALNTLFEECLSGNLQDDSYIESELSTISTRLEVYSQRLDKLQTSHIFQWATYYRDTVGFIFKDLFDLLENVDNWDDILQKVFERFEDHAFSISNRGIQYSQKHGLADEASHYKTLSGLQQFLYLIMNLYIDFQDKIITSKQSNIARNITSALLSSVFSGYEKTLSWERLCSSYRHWIPAFGFMNGEDAISLLQEIQERNGKLESVNVVFDTIVPVLLAVDTLSNKLHGSDCFFPRFSRVVPSDQFKLDIILSAVVNKAKMDILISSVFAEELTELDELHNFESSSLELAVFRASSIIKDWIEERNHQVFIEASHVAGLVENAKDLSEIIVARIEKKIKLNADSAKSLLVSHNYAKEFPLEDPDTRRLFMVERHSVKKLLEEFELETGVHLWCSVRRSGKTTAAMNLSGRFVIVFQTMDYVTEQTQQNIFTNEIMRIFEEAKPLPTDFFESVVEKCVVASGIDDTSRKKTVFLLDEYETLFGMLGAMSDANQIFRFTIALPLLSQMVRFSSRNLLIFMGQRPDAYHIIPAQNQLSPIVKQKYFPLFEHHKGAVESEFSQFLKRVLTQNLPFTTSFLDAVYDETSGHPYLTVNLMVDFCDWLVTNNVESGSPVDANRFQLFSRDRLSLASLSRSTFYQFFQSQFSGYLSEKTRKDELWLYAVARVLHQIGTRHPKVLSCPMGRYNDYALKALVNSTVSPQQLLSSGKMSNFLKTDEGHVKPAIRLMARLAACSISELN